MLHEPFTKRVWTELGFFLLGSALAGVGLVFVACTMGAGLVLAITFFGLAVLALSLRSPWGIGSLQRGLVRSMLGETVATRRPSSHAGVLGWLILPARSCGVARGGLSHPQGAMVFLGAFVPFSLWWDVFALLIAPIFGRNGGGSPVWGLVSDFFPRTFNGYTGFLRDLVGLVLGAIFFFAAPGSCGASSTSTAC